MVLMHITDASGRGWEYTVPPRDTCTIGRAPGSNSEVLRDSQASRHHGHITYRNGGGPGDEGELVDAASLRRVPTSHIGDEAIGLGWAPAPGLVLKHRARRADHWIHDRPTSWRANRVASPAIASPSRRS